MADDWTHEETDSVDFADARNFYKVEKWTKDESKVDRPSNGRKAHAQSDHIACSETSYHPNSYLLLRLTNRLLRKWKLVIKVMQQFFRMPRSKERRPSPRSVWSLSDSSAFVASSFHALVGDLCPVLSGRSPAVTGAATRFLGNSNVRQLLIAIFPPILCALYLSQKDRKRSSPA
jgi:hypothetical protein